MRRRQAFAMHAIEAEQRRVATPAVVPAPSDGVAAVRAEYERVFGEKPHHRLKVETMRARIDGRSQ